MQKFVISFLYITTILVVDSARVLMVYPVSSYSHYTLGNILGKELATRGHNVTMITPYLENASIKNFKQILLTGYAEECQDIYNKLLEYVELSAVKKIIMTDVLSSTWTEKILNHTNVQRMLKSKEKFDLVILEQFFNEALQGICYHFQAPCVVFSAVGSSRRTNPQMGNPNFLIYIADLFMSLPMNVWEIFYNSLGYVELELLTHLYTLPKHNQLLKKYFPSAPHLYDLYYNTSLMLLNSDSGLSSIKVHLPNMIEIGGFHIKPPKILPKELQTYLDDSQNGVILFSLGSVLKSKQMPKRKREALLATFAKLRENVLCKWENEESFKQPPNVKFITWFPQQDILAHPNVKLLVTHGGSLSLLEAAYYGVPIIGIPVYGDQSINSANAEIEGYGLTVPFTELTKKTFSYALNEILSNSKYTKIAKSKSRIMRDQPMKPLDRAVFWVEYVLRHQGALHLRSSALNIPWYQYLLLDVLALIFLFLVVIFIILYKIVQTISWSINIKD